MKLLCLAAVTDIDGQNTNRRCKGGEASWATQICSVEEAIRNDVGLLFRIVIPFTNRVEPQADEGRPVS